MSDLLPWKKGSIRWIPTFTDVTLSPEVIIQLYAAPFPIELGPTERDLKQYCGPGDYQCDTSLAIHRFVHLVLTAFCLWRLTMLRD
jgi:hypothetical protein